MTKLNGSTSEARETIHDKEHPEAMILNFLTKVFGSKNERVIRKMQPLVDRINGFEPEIKALSNDELKNKTAIFRERIDNGEPLDDLLPEAFAVVREASVRTLGMRHYDVQLIGGMVLHQGRIAEMKTGEGKTLVCTLAAYLNALPGKGVHVVTVNDYLATRDAEWMGQLYRFLGLSVDTIVHGLDDKQRKAAYAADITYGTNNEFGFDYLRDNMKFSPEALVQRALNFAVVDEVDSILVDEARTPLIISGPAEKSSHMYTQVNEVIPKLKTDEDYTVDEKLRTAMLTEEGVAKSETLLGVENIYDPKNIDILHHLNQALKAHSLFKRDRDYIVKDNEVIIVDEFTGRTMPGRRYSEGLHQALEAKEGVKIENENQTLATITFQNYFRMYDKLSGMTGTADTEAAEFKKIYDLDVVVIPTNKPMIRKDYADVIYKTKKEKFDAVIEEIEDCHRRGQPVLVGTISIDVSEDLSKKLKKRKIPHSVLNAKYHDKEAEIIAQAGRPGAVTIATNMAGRGTDIVLGGSPDADIPDEESRTTEAVEKAKAEWQERHDAVIAAGGLHIIGTERHESRRIDNQLRGRSGRQGDPGSSRFYLALDDDLLRIFGGERITGIMERLGLEDGEPIEHGMISRAIENAQAKVEGRNFDIRKQLLEYDDVMNKQREVIYERRREILTDESLRPILDEMIAEKAEEIAYEFADAKVLPEDWDIAALNEAVLRQFNVRLDLDESALEGMDAEKLQARIYDEAIRVYNEKEMRAGEELRALERYVMLQTLDGLWKDHLLNMDHLKEGIGLRGYAQQNPLLVYKKEAYEMFGAMIEQVKEETLAMLFRVDIATEDEIDRLRPRQKADDLVFSGGEGAGTVKKKPVRRAETKVGRNDPCPCGSGRKYKKCCGK